MQCETCIHKEVCKYSDDIINAENELNEKLKHVVDDKVQIHCECSLYRSKTTEGAKPYVAPYVPEWKPNGRNPLNPYEITCDSNNQR